jgi:hypothetical protein
MSTAYLSIPRELTIDGIMHLQHWRTKNHIIYQSYSLPRATSDQPLQDRTPQIAGQNYFKVYAIIQHQPFGEELGALLATYGDLQSAITFVEKAEQLA